VHNFEYVMSGAAHTRITLNDAAKGEAAKRIKNIFDKTEALSKNHKYTVLYNGFTEESLGASMYAGGFVPNPMHSDSGGLQMITRGMQIDEETKLKVYKSQLKYSKYAMCFDEIPVEIHGEKSFVGAMNKVFRPDWVEDKAKQTAFNIVEQAKVFEAHNSETQIMLIGQGNCLDSYLKWIDICVKNIPKSLHHRIGGLSFAGTSAGSGEIEDIERLYAASICDAPIEWKKQLHLLGIGSIRRLAPVIGFIYSGVFSNMKISYDSTSHSSGISYRRFKDINDESIQCGYDNTTLTQLYNYAKEYFDIEATFKEFDDIINKNREFFLKHHGIEKIHIFHESIFSSAMVSILHTTNKLDELCASKKAFKKYVLDKCSREMLHLCEVKTRSDYDNFINDFSKYLTSQRINRHGENSSLDKFF
jgi:hypothetical protein